MKYFLIAGEASGDIHASHLITALRQQDAETEFQFFGGDKMEAAAGGGLLNHYSTLAYMGFIQVALHSRTILRGLDACKAAIAAWQPDCVILIDYPGFNLKVAKWIKEKWNANLGAAPKVYYYISPKVWAWKEGRVKSIRRYVDRLFSILPFEPDFYSQKHGYEVTYVGNPTYDEVAAYIGKRREDINDVKTFGQSSPWRDRSVALMPGSRLQEIRANLPIMMKALPEKTRVSIIAAPGVNDDIYRQLAPSATVAYGNPYDTLRFCRAALVTSGTATLEAALLDVPQVVCYNTRPRHIIAWLRPHFLKCRFISLVNLIADAEVVPELVAAQMTPESVRTHLEAILEGPARDAQLEGYATVRQRIAQTGAPQKAASEIVSLLKARQ